MEEGNAEKISEAIFNLIPEGKSKLNHFLINYN